MKCSATRHAMAELHQDAGFIAKFPCHAELRARFGLWGRSNAQPNPHCYKNLIRAVPSMKKYDQAGYFRVVARRESSRSGEVSASIMGS